MHCSKLEHSNSKRKWIKWDDSYWLSGLKTICLTLIAQIDGVMARFIISTVEASEIQYQLHTIITFALPLPNSLKKGMCLNITDEALTDKPLVSDPESNTSVLSSGISTYGGKEIESMLGYIDEDTVVPVTWPKTQKKPLKSRLPKPPGWNAPLLLHFNPFLGWHDIESIRALVIASRPKSKLGQ